MLQANIADLKERQGAARKEIEEMRRQLKDSEVAKRDAEDRVLKLQGKGTDKTKVMSERLVQLEKMKAELEKKVKLAEREKDDLGGKVKNAEKEKLTLGQKVKVSESGLPLIIKFAGNRQKLSCHAVQIGLKKLSYKSIVVLSGNDVHCMWCHKS